MQVAFKLLESMTNKRNPIYNSVCGLMGTQLNKVFEFTFGDKSVKYYWSDEDKTFIFLANSSQFNNETMLLLKDRFEKFFVVKIKFIN